MDRWQHIEALFDEVLDLPPERRAAFLNDLIERDPEVGREIASLLESHEEASGFFDDLLSRVVSPMVDRLEEEPPAPERVGPYRVVREVGRGGMSTVYLAARDDGQFEQEVALKVIRQGANTAERRRRFLEERRILASLMHPHVARLYDGGVLDDGRPYFVMEYVDGQPIDRYCDAQCMALEERLRLFRAVLDAVQYAHRNLVVHRDLKPSNILVTEEGTVKLLDFGIAKVLDEGAEAHLTQTGARWMTPEFAAPEQVRGERVTTATDVYQLGVMLYRLLTGHRPYRLTSTSTYEVERAVVEADPTRPSTVVGEREEVRWSGATVRITPESVAQHRNMDLVALRRTLAGDLDAILLKALRKEPEARYPSAEAFAEDIRRFLQGQPVAARRGSLGYRMRKYVRRHRWGIAAVVAIVLLLAGYALTTTVQARRIAEERDRARLEAAKARQVTGFMIDMFETSDPNAAQGNTVTAREILDQGALRVHEELKTQPEVQAQMLDAIGQVYEKLGLYDEARASLETALALRRKLLTPPHPALAEALHHLAGVLDRTGAYDGAEARLREAVSMWRRLPETEVPHAESLRLLATVRKRLDDYAAADSLYQRALAVQRAALGETHEAIAETLTRLAELRRDQGNVASADSLYAVALAMQRDRLGGDHLTIARTLKDYALVKEDLGRFGAADSLYAAALAMYRRLVGSKHPDVAVTLNDYGLMHRNQGNLQTAERLLREALDIKREMLGDDDPSMAIAYYNLAVVLHDQRAYAASESLYRRTLAIDRKVFGEEHSEIAADLIKLAEVLRDQESWDEADRLYTEALAILRTALPASRPMATALLGYGRLRLDQRRPHEAASMLREALSIRRAFFGDEHWRLAEVQAAQGACLAAQGQYEEAESLLLRSYQRLAAGLDEDDPRTQRALADLVALYEAWGRSAEAKRYRARLRSS